MTPDFHDSFVYFPSFSTGEFANYAKHNKLLSGKLTPRFWADDFPKEFQHKYFLLTAGHLYKKMDIRKQMGLENALVMGDSGGYQISTGAIKWDLGVRQQIFEWLEANSDLALNIDIPTFGNYAGRFNECLDISYDNFKYFYEKQSGKTKFLNVMQGANLHQRQVWYNKVKDFEFKGWALGGARNSYKLAASIATLINGKEHLKPNIEYIHVLGTSKVSDFFYLSQIQKSISEVGSTAKITTDSSTPSRGLAFGLYYSSVSYSTDVYKTLHIPKSKSSNKDFVPPVCVNTITPEQRNMHLPYVTEFDKIINPLYTYGEAVDGLNDSSMYMTLHNFMVFRDSQKIISHHVYHHDYMLEQFASSDTYKVTKILDEIIKSDDPLKVVMKHESYLMSLDNAAPNIATNNSVSEFFSL